jgi:hypothetical protein
LITPSLFEVYEILVTFAALCPLNGAGKRTLLRKYHLMMIRRDKIMKATEDLKKEHKGVTLMLRILEKICVSYEADKTIDKDHMEKILEFLTVFVDTCHHGKEEEFLFPALVSVGIPKEGGPIEVMRAEHDQGRSSGVCESICAFHSLRRRLI